jgi:hypothetical protein
LLRRPAHILNALAWPIRSPTTRVETGEPPLCEDLIYGSWLRTLPQDEADELVALSTLDDIFKSVGAQNKFLPKAYDMLGRLPDGTIPSFALPDLAPSKYLQMDPISPPNFCTSRSSRHLGSDWAGRREDRLAFTIWRSSLTLARRTSFSITAARKPVHTNLHNMGRMVWGNPKSGEYTISSRHFSGYYRLFSLTYGVWLASEIINRIAVSEFPVQCELINETAYSVWLAIVIAGLARNGALPPLVTSEELRWPHDQSQGHPKPPSSPWDL